MESLSIEVKRRKPTNTVFVEIDVDQAEHEGVTDSRKVDVDENAVGIGGVDLLSKKALIDRLEEITQGQPDQSKVRALVLSGDVPSILAYLDAIPPVEKPIPVEVA